MHGLLLLLLYSDNNPDMTVIVTPDYPTLLGI